MRLQIFISLLLLLTISLVYTPSRFCHAQSAVPKKTAKKAQNRPISIVDEGKHKFEFEMVPFEKQKEFLDEPFQFSSAEAENIWNFLISKEPHLRIDPNDMRFMGGSFARLGSDSYLIEYYAFYFAQPKKGKLIALTQNLPPGNYDLNENEIRHLGKDTFWVLLSGENYNNGIASRIYYALVFELKPDGSVIVTSSDMARFEEYGEGLCNNPDPDLDYPDLEFTARVNDYSIKDSDHDSREDIIFFVEEQNCKTKEIRQTQRVFLNQGNGFIEKVPRSRTPGQLSRTDRQAAWP